MYKTLYFLLSTALIIETKYCVFIPLQIQQIIVGWFNGNQLMVDLVAHYKGLFPSSLLEGFPLKTV
jgi:hypothetical protein